MISQGTMVVGLERKAYMKLKEWKEASNGSTALLIDGARRVGKSYLAVQFAEKEYDSYILIDFAQVGSDIKRMFEEDISDLDFFFSKLSTLWNVTLHRRRSLIIFDEVQCFPLARQLIKKFVADGRYDYIETGSLLSIKTHMAGILLPSEEIHLVLHPMDFEEFLWAMGDHISVDFLRGCYDRRMPVGEAIHKKMMMRIREYMLVGGMPGAVSTYVDTRDFAATDMVKRAILDLYRGDIPRFAVGYEAKVIDIFDKIPSELSRKEKKFRITSITKDARQRQYDKAFLWLSDGMVTSICYNATDPTVGLSMYLDDSTFKCYMEDTGLLITHAMFDKDYAENTLYKSILLDKVNVNEGMILENLVAQMLKASRHKLFFYSRPKRIVKDDSGAVIRTESALEIDFLVDNGGKICPIEVKSSGYAKHSSLDRFKERFGKRIGEPVIVYTKDLAVKDGTLCIPIYMAIFL